MVTSLPINSRDILDKWMRVLVENGTFLIKTCYNLLHKENIENMRREQELNECIELWTLPILCKVKHFYTNLARISFQLQKT